jgi:hypothetical protein
MERRTTLVLFVASFLFLLCLGVYSLSPHQETRFFQKCYESVRDSCFEDCKNYVPSAWDQWSTAILGNRVSRKKTYNVCEAKCLTFSHINCTEENFKNGGTTTFKMFGKYPVKPVWIFEEFFSMLFALISLVVYSNYYRIYCKITSVPHAEAAFPFLRMYRAYFLVWATAFSLAALFHTKDTPLTEKLDYYSAILALLYSVYIAFCR